MCVYIYIYKQVDKYICIHELEKDLMFNNTSEKKCRKKQRVNKENRFLCV